MKNVWKGMVIGALTGAATGLALDIGERGAKGAVGVGSAIVDHVPDVAGQVRHAVGGVVANASERGHSSDLLTQANSAGMAAGERLSAALSGGLDRASGAVGHGRDLVESAGRETKRA